MNVCIRTCVLSAICFSVLQLFFAGAACLAVDGKKDSTVLKQPGLTNIKCTAEAHDKALAGAEVHKSNGQNFKPIEVEGEVVDAWCWSSGVMGEGRGKKHHSCALACVMGGVSCGIVDDNNNLYICAKHKAYKGCNEMLAPFVAKRVKVKGWITERGGCRLLKVGEVNEVVKPAK